MKMLLDHLHLLLLLNNWIIFTWHILDGILYWHLCSLFGPGGDIRGFGFHVSIIHVRAGQNTYLTPPQTEPQLTNTTPREFQISYHPERFCRFDMNGVHPNRKLHPEIPPNQIFYLLYARVHPLREYGHPSNLIPPTLTPAKPGFTPLTLDHTPGSIWTPAGQW